MKSFNAGFALLRIWMSFEVVLCHFWRIGDSTEPGLLFLRRMESNAVPVFMLMSFFLAAEKFAKDDSKWLARRFLRIGVPFVVWSVVTWLGIKAGSLFTDSARFQVSLSDLGWELVLGCSPKICPQFWFQVALLVMTAVVAVAMRVARPARAVAVAVGALLASFFLQYTGLVGSLFDNLPYEAKWTLGRLSPMLAYAGLGLLLGMARPAIDRASVGVRVATAILSAGIMATVYFHPLVALPPGGYGYDGFELLFEAVLLLAVFYYWPADRLPRAVVSVLRTVSTYTMGVYCMHLLLGTIVSEFILPSLGIAEKSMSCAVFVYCLSWAACLLLAKIPHVERLVK